MAVISFTIQAPEVQLAREAFFLMQHFEANLFMSKFDLINVRPSRSYSKFKNSEELLFRITVSKG